MVQRRALPAAAGWERGRSHPRGKRIFSSQGRGRSHLVARARGWDGGIGANSSSAQGFHYDHSTPGMAIDLAEVAPLSLPPRLKIELVQHAAGLEHLGEHLHPRLRAAG